MTWKNSAGMVGWYVGDYWTENQGVCLFELTSDDKVSVRVIFRTMVRNLEFYYIEKFLLPVPQIIFY